MQFCDTRPIKFDEKTLESLSESDDEIKVPSPLQRSRIEPSNPKPKPARKNFTPKLTQCQLALLAKSTEDPQSSNQQTEPSPTPKPKPGRSTHNSLRAGIVENSENDQTLNNSTDKENFEGGKKFVNKDPAKKYPRSKIVVVPNRSQQHWEQLQFAHTVYGNQNRKRGSLPVCGAQMCSQCLRNSTGMSRISTQMSNTPAGFVTDHLNRMEVNANMKFHTYPRGTSVSIVTVDSISTAN